MFAPRPSFATTVPVDVTTKVPSLAFPSRKVKQFRVAKRVTNRPSLLPRPSVFQSTSFKSLKCGSSPAKTYANISNTKVPLHDVSPNMLRGRAHVNHRDKVRKANKARLQLPEHSLSIAFKSLTEDYKIHLSETIPAGLDDAHMHVEGHFRKAVDHSHNHLDQYNELIQPVCRSFGDEGLVIIQKRGTVHEQKIQSTISARMDAFQRVLVEESATQTRLLHELHQINDLMRRLDDGMQDSPSINTATDTTGLPVYASDFAKVEAKYVRKRDEILARFQWDCNGLIKKVGSEEKQYAQRAKLANQKFQRLLQATINEQDELAED